MKHVRPQRIMIFLVVCAIVLPVSFAALLVRQEMERRRSNIEYQVYQIIPGSASIRWMALPCTGMEARLIRLILPLRFPGAVIPCFGILQWLLSGAPVLSLPCGAIFRGDRVVEWLICGTRHAE